MRIEYSIPDGVYNKFNKQTLIFINHQLTKQLKDIVYFLSNIGLL